MKANFYNRHGAYYAQIIKDNGGVLVESSGATTDAAIQNLYANVQSQFDTWKKADYITRLMVMTTASLFSEIGCINDQIVGNNNPEADCYWQRDVLNAEVSRRNMTNE